MKHKNFKAILVSQLKLLVIVYARELDRKKELTLKIIYTHEK